MKKILLFAALMTAAFSCFAGNIDAVSAKAVAQHFMNSKINAGRINARPAADLKLALTELNSKDVTKNVYYIFNSKDGFVIVSGEDRGEQILAYGDRALDVNNIPVNMRGFLEGYKEDIEYLQAHPGFSAKLTAPSLNAVDVPELLTERWDQDVPYYNQCPNFSGRCLTGCPATSLAMIFHFWKYPTDETGIVPGYSYLESSYWSSTTRTLDPLPSITFDWDNMLDVYGSSYTTAQGNAVAWLMRYVGQAEHMEYGTDGSGIDADSCILLVNACKFFGYDEETVKLYKKTTDYNDSQENYTDAEWAKLIQDELAEGRPIEFCALSSYGGHAFNVDGYRVSDNKYHVNFGWSGSGNGWFALNAFNGSGSVYNRYQQMVIGIQPPAAVPTIKVSPSNIDMEAYPGKPATATFTVKGVLLENNITLTLNDESGLFSIDANNVSVSECEGGKVITVTYAPQAVGHRSATITLSTPGADDKTVIINGTSVLEVYKPVMLPAAETYVNLTQFRAEWTDATPAANVASYTLEVGTKPATELIVETDWSDNTASRSITYEWEDYLPEGWTFSGSAIWSEPNAISLATNSSIATPLYDLTGYDKVTVVVETRHDPLFSASSLQIQTGKASQTINCPADFETFTVVLDCNENDAITFTGTSYPHMKTIKIYAGDASENMLRATETGDATYRLIEGIGPDQFYTVMNLEAAGTYYYKVRTRYIDGTQSVWSNSQMVTLFENGHSYEVGDVDHNGTVDPADISSLINYLLNGTAICPICGDIDCDGDIDPADISGLINFLLNGN